LSDPELGPGPGIYYQQQFQLDHSYDIYDREVFTIIGIFQEVGGFYNALYFVMLVFHSQFSNAFIFSALLRRLYWSEESEKQRAMGKKLRREMPTLPSESSKYLQALRDYIALRRPIGIQARDIIRERVLRLCCKWWREPRTETDVFRLGHLRVI